MAPDPPSVDTVEQRRAWILDHHGRIETLWNQQHAWNLATERKIDASGETAAGCKRALMDEVKEMKKKTELLDGRVTRLEVRLAIIFAAAVVLGQVAGHMLAKLL